MSEDSFASTEEWRGHVRSRLEAQLITTDYLSSVVAKPQVAIIGRSTRGTALEKRGMQRLEKILEKLSCLLRKLPPERRRSILMKQFVQAERLVLEQWLLAEKARGQGAIDTRTCDAPTVAQCPAPKSSVANEGLACRKRGSRTETNQGVYCRRNNMRRKAKLGRHLHRVDVEAEKCRGIQSCSDPGGRVSYFIKLMVTDSLLIRTNIVRDLHLVRLALAALISVRAAVAGVDAFELESRLEEELDKSFWSAAWNPGRLLRLQYCVIVAARCWIGQQLATPYFADLRAALAARCQLLWARGVTRQGHRSDLMKRKDADAAWIKVSAAYAAVCAEAGRSYSAACSRLSALRKFESARRLRQARHMKGAAMQKAAQAQLRLEARETRRRQEVERKAGLAERRVQRAADRTARIALSLERRIAQLLSLYRKCLKKLLL